MRKRSQNRSAVPVGSRGSRRRPALAAPAAAGPVTPVAGPGEERFATLPRAPTPPRRGARAGTAAPGREGRRTVEDGPCASGALGYRGLALSCAIPIPLPLGGGRRSRRRRDGARAPDPARRRRPPARLLQPALPRVDLLPVL